ncbi:MAG: hypothetical protein Q7V88_10695 [Actinomycetota bacterium]|nr:hypothetical protein [Actinomycetota bacterium]
MVRRAVTADWQAVFSAMACYGTTSPTQQRDLAAAAATLADDAGFPLLVDLRPGLVIIDSGKDQWEDDAHGLELDFADPPQTSRPLPADSGPPRIRGCRARLLDESEDRWRVADPEGNEPLIVIGA